MINSWCYDVEILPNFFSVTFVNLNDYLKTFKDANDGSKKLKPIPLVKKYKVKEIIEMLDKVDKRKFYITDTDDSQLLSLIGFINNMRPQYIDGKPVRTDLFGYNSNGYDKLMITAFLMYANQVNNTKELITKLYETSKHIINVQDNKELNRQDYYLSTLRKYNLPFINIDVMTMFALNKCGKGVDKDGNVVYFPKSLKQTSINLQWYELLEHQLPPISDKDIHYYHTIKKYSDIPADKLNYLIDKWDRYVIDEWIDDIMHYNTNDVFIVCEMIRLFIDEVRLRYNISKAYEIDVLSSSRSNIADKLFVKFYSEFSGLAESQWRGQTTERKALSFKRVIFPFIKFKTKECQELLNELKTVVIYSLGKKSLRSFAIEHPELKYIKYDNNSGWFDIKINKLVYTIATGGLHSQDVPRELISSINPSTGKSLSEAKCSNIWNNITDDSYVYVHWDISDAVSH